ncbi:uncharacterized protein SAMN05421788_101885 [Filimonas lacunae]|uniref:HD/PDEase domain-containing protein n=1 Tax=Filimonas lacunae TaxID=477680 RepID=A0A173MPT8_9BACT|nr:HD domain-containing protein [Filimonas lacunae]BAV09450.1 metal-dependent phosphohydrolase [Filimonas lacunae]SIS73364.1 uncharacterized protein SAMN05421788_101885 [Filimonas lacunae]
MSSISLQQWEALFIQYLTQHAPTNDASHNISHFTRVWNTCCTINEAEGHKADALILLTASYFHDLVSVPKNSPDRNKASLLSAEKTEQLLTHHFAHYPADKIAGVKHAIHAHSFSAAIATETYEAAILQDADRMEALGAIGIARTFYTAGMLHTQMFHPTDPLAQHRPLNDTTYALDHFQVKLLQLPGKMNTATGKQLATQLAAVLTQFMQQLVQETTGV